MHTSGPDAPLHKDSRGEGNCMVPRTGSPMNTNHPIIKRQEYVDKAKMFQQGPNRTDSDITPQRGQLRRGLQRGEAG